MQSFPLASTRTARALGGLVAAVVGLSLAFGLMAGVMIGIFAGIILTIEGNPVGLALLALIVFPPLLVRYRARSKGSTQRAAVRRRRPPEPHVALGSDGILVQRWLSARFLAWSRVRAVRRTSRDEVVVELGDGTTERVRVVDVAEVEHALLAGKARHESAGRSAAIRLLEPDGQPDARWIQRAKGLITEPAYRVESIGEEALLGVLEDSAQRPVQRIGAALALSGASDRVVKRMRVAIEDTAEPELSRALHDAGAGDIDSRTLQRVARKSR